MLHVTLMEAVLQMLCSYVLERPPLAFSWKRVRTLSAMAWTMVTGYKHGLLL